ncbi:hypothetical protein ACFQ3N_16700 [Virgibacillus byunsanensis]|uniref:Uncharacterized protein n=1 Tax=Virgibacillus byunsanensis TaxID=570945 RepID=A0ABW3LSL8_9BACI
MANERVKSQILETVENQLKMEDPICTTKTYQRLRESGYSGNKAKEMIGAILIEEMYLIMKDHVPFSEERYAKKLSDLK